MQINFCSIFFLLLMWSVENEFCINFILNVKVFFLQTNLMFRSLSLSLEIWRKKFMLKIVKDSRDEKERRGVDEKKVSTIIKIYYGCIIFLHYYCFFRLLLENVRGYEGSSNSGMRKKKLMLSGIVTSQNNAFNSICGLTCFL